MLGAPANTCRFLPAEKTSYCLEAISLALPNWSCQGRVLTRTPGKRRIALAPFQLISGYAVRSDPPVILSISFKLSPIAINCIHIASSFSIQALTARLNEFEAFLKSQRIRSIKKAYGRHTGIGQAILLILKDYRCKNKCFEDYRGQDTRHVILAFYGGIAMKQ